MAKPSGEPAYSISAVSKLTGVSCHALRIWERRYGFPRPLRSPSGQRRYSREQVEDLIQLAEQLRSGRSIGELIGELSSPSPSPSPRAASQAITCLTPEFDELITLLIMGDIRGAEALFDTLTARFDALDVIDQVIVRTLIESGERWYRGDCEVFEEHCITEFLRRKLKVMIDAALRANPTPAWLVVVGTVLGERHEGGGLLVTLMLERAGWGVIYLGSDLPVSEIVRAVERFRPDALALSFVLSRNVHKRFQELSKIVEVPIFVGGRSILNYQSLARRHGLIPLVGPIASSVEEMKAVVQEWKARHSRPTPPADG
jgi:methanogenic corrinoid protein MtbC1